MHTSRPSQHFAAGTVCMQLVSGGGMAADREA